MNVQSYNINLRVGTGITQNVKISQGDVGRELVFYLYDGAVRFSPPSGATVKIKGVKPSGLGFNETCTLSGSVARVFTTLAMTQEGGNIPTELEISNGSTVIGTANFILHVEPSPHPAGTTDGTTEEARTVLAQCEEYAQAAQDAADSATEDYTEIRSDVDDLSADVSQLRADLGAYSNKAIKALSFSDGAPSGDYSIVFPTFVQGGISSSGTTITYNESAKDIRTETPVGGGHLIHNLDTNNNNIRVYIFYNGTYTGRLMRDAEWNSVMPGEWVYLPIISGYTYQICFHTTGSGITPGNAPIEMLRIAESENPLNDVVPGYSWNSTDGTATNSNRAYMIFPGVKKGDVIKFGGERYSVNYYVLGGNLTDLIYTPNVWDSTGEIKVNVPDDKSYQLFVQFKWSDNGDIVAERAVYISNFTQIITELKTIDLFMFMGQSNMAGRGITNSTWTEKAPKINYGAGYEFKAISDPTKLYPASEPFGVDENQTGGIDDTTPDNEDLTTGVSKKTGSCVVALMNTYFGATGIPIVGVSASEGGTTITQWQPNTDRLDDAISRLNNAATWLETNGYYIRHKYMMWCQGENDSSTPSVDYKTYFSAMFGAMKTAGIEKCFLARIGEYNNGSSTAYSAMIQCQTEIGQEMADVIMCTTDLASFRDRGLMKDNYHFYQAAYNEMGRYSGANIAAYVETGKEPTMYDPKYNNLYYSHKN